MMQDDGRIRDAINAAYAPDDLALQTSLPNLGLDLCQLATSQLTSKLPTPTRLPAC